MGFAAAHAPMRRPAKNPVRTLPAGPACCLLIAGALLVVLSLAACGNDGGRSARADARPQLAGPVAVIDADRNGAIGAGDYLVIHFDRDVFVQSNSIDGFALPVQGDAFGAGAKVEPGARTDEVQVVLGAGAVLRARGTFMEQRLASGNPSGVALAPDAGILDAETGLAPRAQPARDLVPGFLEVQSGLPPAPTRGLAAGDLDADGDVDLVVGNAGEPSTVWWNEGSLRFSDSGQRLATGTLRALALGDVDTDGDLDLVTGDDIGASLWRNDGAGGFAAATSIATTATTALALGDVDADGDLDVLQGAGEGRDDRIWTNDGAGGFTSGDTLTTGTTQAVALVDVDGDGDLDAVLGADSGANRIWRNDGNGGFADAGQDVGTGPTTAVLAARLDCDHDVDLVTVGAGTARVWSNDGTGRFALAGRLDAAATGAVALLPADDDARLDVFAGSSEAGPSHVFYLREGPEVIGSGQRLGTTPATALAAADFDGDGDTDVVAAALRVAPVFWASSLSGTAGGLGFDETGSQLGQGGAVGLAVGDMDRDGYLDVVEAKGTAPAAVHWRNDGTGAFVRVRDLTTGISAVALADVDHDGDLDLLAGGETTGLHLWRADRGELGLPSLISTAPTVALAVADVDRNGTADVLLAGGPGSRTELWLNDGTGAFLASAEDLPQGALAVVLLDFEGDGDRDVVLGTEDGLQLLANAGDGTFPDRRLVGQGIQSALAAGDVDGDGDVDFAAGGPAAHAIWRNDGTGEFAPPKPDQDRGSATFLAFMDVDRDGDLDLWRGGAGGSVLLQWNDGTGEFMAAQLTLRGTDQRDLVAGDLDCDGDVDLLTAESASNGGLRVWLHR